MEPKRTLKEYDVVVVGGGFAGFGAAIGAAQAGARTLLIEATGVLGGLGVNGLVNPFMKYDYEGEILIQGVFTDLVDALKAEDAYVGRAFSYEAVKYQMAQFLQNANVDLLLYSQVIDLTQKADQIEELIVVSFGQHLAIRGKEFIDCTGDSILGKLAGLTLLTGDDTTGKNQAMTQMFVLENVDLNKTMEYVRTHPDDFFSWVDPNQREIAISVAGFFELVEQAERDGMELPRDHFFFIQLPEKSAVVVNTGHILVEDANDPLVITQAQLQGMEQTHALTRFAQAYLPGFEKCYLRQSATQVGIRESARIKGEYIFSQSDVESFAKFDDAVLKAIYGVDIHKNEDEKSEKEVKLDYSNYYEIPARALIAAEKQNLLMAGRNLSADFGGQSAVRIMPTCCGMGQGAGVIAALAAKKGCQPKQVEILDFQNELKRQGANL